MWCYLLVVLVLLSTVSFQVVKSHADGTNVDTACQTLLPGHGPPSQNSLPPYKISFSPPRYIPGEPISITLLSCKDAFKGFMIQAHSAETSRNQDERFGNFTASENKLACNGSALVHSNNSPKTTVNIAWNPPAAPKGHIIFRVTYVKDFGTYWTNITSDVLYDASLNTSGVLYNKSDVDATCTGGVKPVTTTNVTKDSGCGSTKGCFSSCSADGCTFIASWASDNKTATYNLSSEILYQGNMYIALGFSSDSKMGDDSVMACATNSSGSVFLILGFNTGHYKPETFNDSEVQLVSNSIVNGVLSCAIRRPLVAKEKRFDVSHPWTLLAVQGATLTASTGIPELQYHGDRFYIAKEQVTVDSIVDLGVDTLENPMIKAHGCLMVAAWIFLASVGIVVARYYKPVWEVTLCSENVWFQLHRICMVLVFCATAAAFIIIFVEVKEWSEFNVEGKQFLEGHPIIGVIVMALTLINPIMAVFRPHPGTPKRPIFNWAHWFVGTAAHILAVIAVFFGVQIPDSQVPYYTVYILGAYVAWQLFVEILLELITCAGRRRDRSESYELNGAGDQPKTLVQSESNLISIVKLVILVIHVLVVGALSAAVIAIIAIGERELEE